MTLGNPVLRPLRYMRYLRVVNHNLATPVRLNLDRKDARARWENERTQRLELRARG